ncbi:lysylphosphatidylglycerol synthase transmembrane domain-containing protein [Anaerostipes butyraticus]|nr:lysylphosphatidylglycerol synthase transmembrane domain-containing protein [Anaerostipes butyraticus]HJC83602.1 flippase-like domain-containing protein [Candidatus Anaerostipes avicola]
MKSRKSMIGNAVFFLALFGLTAYAVLKGKEISQLIRVMHSVRPVYYAAGFIFINLFVWCESYIIYRMLRVLQYQQVPKRNCIKYSYVGFFFSCITPSASGGQPAQLYYMNRDKVDVSVGAVILLIVTILYKFVLVFLGTLIFIFRHSLISEYIQGAAFFFYLGMALNVICVIVMFLLVFQQTLASRMIIGLVKGLEKIHVLRRKEERIRKLEDSMMEYHKAAAVIQEHKKLIAGMFGVTLVQRLIHFSITYLIYRGLGLSALGIVDVVALQCVISIAVDMLPLPGGMGISEGLFLSIFRKIFTGGLLYPAMLLSRGISYYALLLISAVMTCVAQVTIKRKE